ncbi:hypothetical protein F7725_027121 [Dissostichus mawsoni]|uniref:3-ketoacyl-[acyl-carrier-protein] reductase beta subunit n=1 Tax=Dissostichus mawsoni TaxID=36200 RepID=A0A7J5XCJ5_DISMA|nr:hypothetical protein F7725_027121 [Dissostichus mawsoni]
MLGNTPHNREHAGKHAAQQRGCWETNSATSDTLKRNKRRLETGSDAGQGVFLSTMSRLAVVCGGSRGIGGAVALLLAERGCRVVVLSRDQDSARAAMEALPGVQRSFETIQKTCGSVSYLVNAAGINRDSLLLRTPPHHMVSMLHTNLLGSMLTCRAALRSMLRPPGGAIVNIGSVVGLKGNAGQSVYSASKSGFIRTDMTEGLEDSERLIPLRRFGTGQEVAQAVLFLLESQYMTGTELLVDGGLHLSM